MLKYRPFFAWSLIFIFVVIGGPLKPTFALGQTSTLCEEIDTPREKTHVRQYQQALVKLYQKDCLGGENDTWPMAVTVTELPPIDELLKDSDPEKFDRIMSRTLLRVKKTLAQEINQARAGSEVADEKRYGTLAALEPLLVPLNIAYDAVQINLQEDDGTTKPWNTGFWKWEEGDGNFGGRIDAKLYENYLQPACADAETQACRTAYASAKRVLRYVYVVERILTDIKTRPQVVAAFQHVTLLNDEWESYFSDTRSQFPWELTLNSYLYNKFDRKAGGAILQAPPRYQWIVMHPSVALEYIDKANEGSQFRESVILEIAGYNWWNWEKRDRDTALGLSFITSYSDRSGIKDVGFGFIAHYNHTLSVGGTLRKGGDPGVFISVDVARFLLKASESTKKAFQFGK